MDIVDHLTSGRLLQSEFARIIGVSEPAVSQMKAQGLLEEGATGLQWLQAYIGRLREQAAGRLGGDTSSGLDPVYENAALRRAQREGQEIKNEVARGTYAPIDLLTDVLSAAAQAAVDRFDQIEAGINRVAPDLPDDVREVVLAEVRSARNEMVKNASSLVERALSGEEVADDEEEDGGLDG